VAGRGLTGVLLVGGESRRFGSPKALARLGGRTLAEIGWATLGDACDERIAVGKAADGLELPFPLLDDGTEIRHPAAGVVAGLRAASHDVVVFLPVDCPAVPAPALRTLGAACRDAAVPERGKPLPGALRKSALPALERCLAFEAPLRGAFETLRVARVDVDPWLLADADTPSDLHRIERRARAVAAATAVAGALGVEAPGARVLQDWNDTVVHLAPHPVVARVGTSLVETDKEIAYRRELAVAVHAAAQGGPVIRPSGLLRAGPHRHDGLVLAFWEYHDEQPGESSAEEQARALAAFHRSLAGYRDALPTLDVRLAGAERVLESRPKRLPAADRELLARVYSASVARFRALARGERVLHGSPHAGNLLRTAAGPRWIDLETVCRGPLEWDLAHLPEAAADAFPAADRDLLAVARTLVSAETAIWCWATYGRAPEVDEAAHFQLGRVRGLAG
jgi:molybdopterin-guanine dinucleotide biosynthesis protein A